MASLTTTTVTLGQLGQHKTRQDLWVAVHGKVYDLTAFAADHPGGIDVLLECAGDDATEPFDYAGHTNDAFAVMAKYKVGSLEGSNENDGVASADGMNHAAAKTGNPNSAKPITGLSNMKKTLISALFAACGLALVFRHGRTIASGLAATSAHLTSTKDANAGWSTSQAFYGGLSVSSLFAILSYALLYQQWHKTLPGERNVFTYPSVIPRRKA